MPRHSILIIVVNLRGYRAACKNIHSPAAMVNSRTDGIPEQRTFLPFVNQPRSRPLQQFVWLRLGKNTI